MYGILILFMFSFSDNSSSNSPLHPFSRNKLYIKTLSQSSDKSLPTQEEYFPKKLELILV